eukprot:6876233-Pyramimonas_sp.AAC.1
MLRGPLCEDVSSEILIVSKRRINRAASTSQYSGDVPREAAISNGALNFASELSSSFSKDVSNESLACNRGRLNRAASTSQ